MIGSDLCVNKPQSVPVIFEPACILVRQKMRNGFEAIQGKLIYNKNVNSFSTTLLLLVYYYYSIH
jgi:hypothetical protein